MFFYSPIVPFEQLAFEMEARRVMHGLTACADSCQSALAAVQALVC